MARRSQTPGNKAAGPEPDSLTYEQAVEELESMIDRIEQGQLGLEESLVAYKRGAALIRRCRAILDVAEQQVEQIKGPGGPANGANDD